MVFLYLQILNIYELVKKFDVPKNLLKLIDNDQKAFLALKIVEIIGEDEPYQLDPETIYFVTNLLNKMDLVDNKKQSFEFCPTIKNLIRI